MREDMLIIFLHILLVIRYISRWFKLSEIWQVYDGTIEEN